MNLHAGLELCQPTDLYNVIQQGTTYPCLSDPNNLLLLDARNQDDYAESHIITAKKAPKNDSDEYIVPYDAELECKEHVVIYDSNSHSLQDDTAAVACGRVMWEMGSRNPVKILKGGYEEFSALYPFLRTQKILYMPRELDTIRTYPLELIPGLLYLGTLEQANAPDIQKDLKVEGHVNCCIEAGTYYTEPGDQLLHVPVEDTPESDMYSFFEEGCQFIDSLRDSQRVVLVFSRLGISRSVCMVLAYLMHHYKWSLKEAWNHANRCCRKQRPNRGFIQQLSKWETDLFEEQITNIEDPAF